MCVCVCVCLSFCMWMGSNPEPGVSESSQYPLDGTSICWPFASAEPGPGRGGLEAKIQSGPPGRRRQCCRDRPPTKETRAHFQLSSQPHVYFWMLPLRHCSLGCTVLSLCAIALYRLMVFNAECPTGQTRLFLERCAAAHALLGFVIPRSDAWICSGCQALQPQPGTAKRLCCGRVAEDVFGSDSQKKR